MKKTAIVFGLVAMLAIFGMHSATANAASSWFVDAGALPNGDGTTLLTATTTIQAAVDAASSGDIVNVAAGTYAEYVAVNKPLAINGANTGTTGTSTRTAESIVDGTDTGAPFAITANDVTIDGFTVENGSNGSLFSGIWSQTGTQNLKIQNNIITQNGFGVWAQCGANCLIQGNLFDSNNKANSPGSGDISADSTNGLTINNNEFKNDTAGNPILLQATGAGAHTNVVVSGNYFHDNVFSNIYVLGVNGGSFASNTIVPASDATGISFSGADANITVSNNVITGGIRGVRVEDAGYFGGAGGNSNITVNRNDVSSNTGYGVGNTDAAISSLDATCNWWGALNGPGPVGPGSGSPVTTNVLFSSWLTTSDLAGSCNGPVPTTVKVTIDKFINGAMATSGSASSSAFPMSSTWTASNLNGGATTSGTYNLDTGDSYEAVTADMTSGASYSTNEDLTGSVVGASCTEGKPYALVGYSTGTSSALAAAAPATTTAPNFTNITLDQFVIVWNTPCAPQTQTLTVSLAGTGSGTVTSTPVGISCPGDCTEAYASGTPVTLVATSSVGSTFAGWSGDCTGTGSCIVTMSSAKTVTATFTQNPILIGPPTDKNQCKNNGWKTFNNPTFKNQGQCVSYVQSNEHAGKRP